jgi:AcrR family transcriptional regulator
MKRPVSPPAKAVKKTNARGRRRSYAVRLTTRKPAPPKKNAGAKRPRGAAVREQVLHAALECFGAFGFEGTSTRAVAERAGVSHPLLLYHFDSKEKLWHSTMEDVVGHYRQELQQRLDQVERNDAAAGLRAFIENFVRFSARVPQLHRIMTQESTQGSERIHWLIEQHLRESFAEVCALIGKAQLQGRVRSGDSARLYYAIIGLAGTLLSVSSEFRVLTGRDVFTETEIRHTIGFICDFVFV